MWLIKFLVVQLSMSSRPIEVTGRRVGAVVGGTLAALPCTVFAYIAFAFSLTGPPGSESLWGAMLSVIVFYWLVPVVVAATVGRWIGGLIGQLLANRREASRPAI